MCAPTQAPPPPKPPLARGGGPAARPVEGCRPPEPAAVWTGHAPNYIRVYAPGTELHNQVLPVKITGLYEDGLLGETVL